MKVIAAFLLAKLGGKENPSAEDLRKILHSVGAETDDGKIELFLSLIKDNDISELMAVGREKLVDFSSALGGGVSVSGGACGGYRGATAVVAAETVAEAKKEKEEIEEESDEEFNLDLFG